MERGIMKMWEDSRALRKWGGQWETGEEATPKHRNMGKIINYN